MKMDSFPNVQDEDGNRCVTSVVGGKDRILPPTASFSVTSAALARVLHHAQSTSENLASEAVEDAAEAFKTHKETRVDQRREWLLRAAVLLESYRDEAVVRQTTETSCSEQWANLNVTWSIEALQEVAATVSTALVGELPPTTHGSIALVTKVPVGLVLIIPPWNAALALAIRGIASALAAGCTVVLKASEICPWTHRLILTVFHEAGFAPSALNMVIADRTVGPQITRLLIAHSAIRKVEFIGSAIVGRIVATLCGKYLKPCILELGDQSPVVVLEDADLQIAADACTLGALIHHGQVCFATERIIVRSEVRDAFQKRLAASMDKFGPMTSAVSLAGARKAKMRVDEALEKGAKLIYGSNTLEGTTLSKSVLTDVDHETSLSKDEGFAPTVILTCVGSDDEAVQEANSRSGGLSASVYTENLDRGLAVAHRLEFGQVQINNVTMFTEPSGPVTGSKGSGWGSNGGIYGISQFLVNKRISLHPKSLQQKN